MTRKHFQALAEALLSTRPEPPQWSGIRTNDKYLAALDTWKRTVKSVADACMASNGNFDRGRFERVCGADI